MKNAIFLPVVLLIFAYCLTTSAQDISSCEIFLEQLSDTLYLDTVTIPDGFDDSTLIRLHDFLAANVIPDRRTPFQDEIGVLPVIVRYVAPTQTGQFPASTEGFAGLCDAVFIECDLPLEGDCYLSLPPDDETNAFLVLIAIPEADSPDYQAMLWGFTAHELAHVWGAIDGPRCPFYEPDKLLAPIESVSDTYYWFGIAHMFEPGFQGSVWDAWQNTCHDALCDSLRTEVFQLPTLRTEKSHSQ